MNEPTIIDPRSIVAALGGQWRGNQGMCRCPAHEDRSPSLSLSWGTGGILLWHCHAGCPQSAVKAALQAKGLLPGRAEGPIYAPRPSPGSVREDEEKKIRLARELWQSAVPAQGTLVEAYLRSRGIRGAVPCSLRFIPSLEHRPTRSKWPAMIAGLTDNDGRLSSIQRTYLASDGKGKAAVKPAKMSLGTMFDAAVRLATASDVLGLAEGIETALSAKQTYSLPVWAVLGCARFATVAVPESVSTVMIFADRGVEGWKAAEAAADRFESEGRNAEIILPPSKTAQDFNDWIRETNAP